MSGTNLNDFSYIAQRVIPGANLRPTGHGGVRISLTIETTLNIDRAVDDRHAEELITSLAEQFRIRAAREMGLTPILEAHTREQRELRQSNFELDALASSRAVKIAQLEERIAELESEYTDGD